MNWNDFWKGYSVSKAEQYYIKKRHNVIQHFLDSFGEEKPVVLEAGCGFASNLRLLSKTNSGKFFALDYSINACNHAKKALQNVVCADLLYPPFKKKSFDVIFNAGVLEHFFDLQEPVQALYGLLKPNGLLLVFVPGKFTLWQLFRKLSGKKWRHGFERIVSKKELENVLKRNGFELLQSGGFDSFTIKGFFLKATGIELPFDLDLGFAQQEIFVAARKKKQ